MSNTHGIPDMAKEVQALCGDLLPPVILSTTWPTVPAASLTLAAFATTGYVRDGTDLIYVEQAAAAVTLSGGDGAYWLALHRNTTTAVSSWTRQAGTHYLWRSNPTQPAQPSGGLILAHVTVAGGVITAVSTLATPQLPLSRQTADAVAITGGTAVLADLDVDGTTLRVDAGNHRVGIGTDTPSYPLDVTGSARVAGSMGINNAPGTDACTLFYDRTTQSGLVIRPGADSGSPAALALLNLASSVVGSITTTAVATAYNTSSDARLKHAIAALAGALDVVRALRPVQFRWNVDDSPGVGFLAHELQAVVPEAVTGVPDAVDAQGQVLPQGVDHSKLVPWLTAALQETRAQLDAVVARVTALEQALGV